MIVTRVTFPFENACARRETPVRVVVMMFPIFARPQHSETHNFVCSVLHRMTPCCEPCYTNPNVCDYHTPRCVATGKSYLRVYPLNGDTPGVTHFIGVLENLAKVQQAAAGGSASSEGMDCDSGDRGASSSQEAGSSEGETSSDSASCNAAAARAAERCDVQVVQLGLMLELPSLPSYVDDVSRISSEERSHVGNILWLLLMRACVARPDSPFGNNVAQEIRHNKAISGLQ